MSPPALSFPRGYFKFMGNLNSVSEFCTIGHPLQHPNPYTDSWCVQVVCLVIKRPPNFSFKPGDYVYLNIPSIAQFEWHPFTISSAPEQANSR